MNVSYRRSTQPTARVILRSVLIISLLGCLALAACSSPQPEPPTTETVSDSAPTEEAPVATVEAPTTAPTPEEPFPGDGPWSVTFAAADGITLHGTLFGKGAAGVVLAPMYIGGEDAWFPFAQMLSENGYRVLTFNYRGYGESEGSRDVTQAAVDVTATVDFLGANDVSPVVIIGAGIGGSAGVKAASQDSTLAGIAAISAPRSFQGLEVADEELSALTIPSLWIGSRNDMTQNTEEMYDLAGGSDKDLWMYEGSSLQGAFIFDGADANDLRTRLLDFVARVTGS
jgi:esterase/lipase